jgi:hypothetical protein
MLVNRTSFWGIVGLALTLPTLAFAGGYGKGACCGFAANSAATLATANTGTLYVRHSDSAAASAFVKKSKSGATGSGNSNTYVETAPGVTAVVQRTTVQRGTAYADNATASGTGASYTAVKVQASDGSYFVYKGSALAGASVGPGGATSSGTASGVSKSGKL